MIRHCFTLLGFLLFAATSAAQPKVTLAAAKDGRVEGVVPVMVPSARCAAISDVHGLLAFGHDKDYGEAQVSLFRLDAKGMPLAYAIPIMLPKPAGLVKNKNYPTGLWFHPKLPLLYVWQDVDLVFVSALPEAKVFDHLCIYNIAKEAPELLISLCRGGEFIYGMQGGAVSVDPTGSYLYVPNVIDVKNHYIRLGRFLLDADGLPVLSEKDAKNPIAPRIKKIAEANAADKFTRPDVTVIEYSHIFIYNKFGSAHCYCPIGKDAVISSGLQGLMTWRPDDKHAALHGLPLKLMGHTQFAVHPGLPAIFATVSNPEPGDSFFRAEHFEGYLTMLPKQYVIPDSKLTGPPGILSKQKKLVVGGEYHVYVMSLDDKGFPAGAPVRMYVNCPQVRALIHSDRFDRAYVGVELSK